MRAPPRTLPYCYDFHRPDEHLVFPFLHLFFSRLPCGDIFETVLGVQKVGEVEGEKTRWGKDGVPEHRNNRTKVHGQQSVHEPVAVPKIDCGAKQEEDEEHRYK